jgi:hypothetical protein
VREEGGPDKARECVEAMHQEKRHEGRGVDRKHAPDDRGRIIRYAARYGERNREGWRQQHRSRLPKAAFLSNR